MVISTLSDSLNYGLQSMRTQIGDTVFGAPIRLGVTGLARSGKTVFMTSLIANLLHSGRFQHVQAFGQNRVELVFLQPQPDDTIPRFAYETHLAALQSTPPRWPENTTGISQIRLSLRLKPHGFLSGLRGTYVQHIDLVDYPGEWLLDLILLDKTYDQWAQSMLDRMQRHSFGNAYLAQLADIAPDREFDETTAQALAKSYTASLDCARASGMADLTPGRFLLPGDLAGSPVLTFAPMPPQNRAKRGSLYREMERRFDAYKAKVVRPFFRDHFSQIDRQVILLDLLGALHQGPDATRDLQNSLSALLQAFRTGQNSILSRLFLGNRVEKILFAATKADHIPTSQHDRMTKTLQALLDQAQRTAQFSGVATGAMSIASVRSTTDLQQKHNGQMLDLVQGTLLETGKPVAFHAGTLPADPQQLLADLTQQIPKWSTADYSAAAFAPPPNPLQTGRGIAHIRLDQAAEFLFGDRL